MQAMKEKQKIWEPIYPRSTLKEMSDFDESTKICTMNCGSSLGDPRSEREYKFQCNDCLVNGGNMIHDYSEVMSHIHKDIIELQKYLDIKDMPKAWLKLSSIQADLDNVRKWIEGEMK